MANAVGVTVTARSLPPSRGLPTDTDTLFLAAKTNEGTPGTSLAVHDLGEFEIQFGPRAAGNTELWDYLDFFFREGGRRAVISPTVAGAAGDLTAALDVMSEDLGPGQLAAVGYTNNASSHDALRDAALTHNRFALLDCDVDDDIAAMSTLGDAITADPDYGALFGPWLVGPGPIGVTGVSERQVPASAGVAALIARVDQTGNPNQAAAGRWLPFQYATGTTLGVLRADFADLLDHAVNPLAEVYGVLEVYGFQTGVPQSADNPMWQANCARMRMALVAQSYNIGEHYMFRPIDGKGLLQNALKTDLDAMLLGYYNLNALYGEEPQDAFSVSVGAIVNPPETIAQGTLKASCEVVLSLHAKSIQIELVTVPVGGTVT